MKVYHLPEKILTLCFDMDLTLYSHPEYGQYQIDVLVEKLGKSCGLSLAEMKGELEEAGKAWALAHNGRKPCLTEIFCEYGIGMEKNVGWREESFEPDRFLSHDDILLEALGKLSKYFVLGVVTNNPVLVARKTLAALGVKDCFSVLVGLDTCMKSKPDKGLFLKFSELSKCPPETCVSIGDRYDIDLSVPLEMGMGGILVDGVDDVYRLPELLIEKGGNYGV